MRLKISEAMASATNKGIKHGGTTGLSKLLEISIPAASRLKAGIPKYIRPEWIIKMKELYQCTSDQLLGITPFVLNGEE